MTAKSQASWAIHTSAQEVEAGTLEKSVSVWAVLEDTSSLFCWTETSISALSGFVPDEGHCVVSAVLVTCARADRSEVTEAVEN